VQYGVFRIVQQDGYAVALMVAYDHQVSLLLAYGAHDFGLDAADENDLVRVADFAHCSAVRQPASGLFGQVVAEFYRRREQRISARVHRYVFDHVQQGQAGLKALREAGRAAHDVIAVLFEVYCRKYVGITCHPIPPLPPSRV